MGDRTKIIASVFPKSCKEEGDKFVFNVHVFLTFRLPETRDGKKDDGLNDYYQVANWTKYAALFKEHISFNFYLQDRQRDIAPVSVPGKYVSHIHTDAAQLWRKMFPAKTPVYGWVLDESPFKLASKMNSPEIARKVREAIDECIAAITDDPSLVDPFNPRNTGEDDYGMRLSQTSLIRYLEELQKKKIPQIIIDPILRDHVSRPGLKNLFDGLNKINNEYQQEVAQLSLEYKLRETELRNYEVTQEFHKRYSAYSNHPELMKRTGCLLEYSFEINKGALPENKKLFIQISDAFEELWVYGTSEKDNKDKGKALGHVGNGTSLIDPATNQLRGTLDPLEASLYYAFFQEIKFVYPLTSVQFSSSGPLFSCAPNPQRATNKKRLEMDQGVVIANTADYTISAEVVDKNQVLQKITDLLAYDKRMQEASAKKTGSNEDMQRLTISEDEKSHLQSEINRSGGISEYISSGITVSITHLTEILETIITEAPVLEPGDIRDAFIFSDNAFGGYRVDVKDLTKNAAQIFSLCQVVENYEGLGEERCEGAIAETAQVSRSGKLFVDEELFRWNDWSLVAPQPGNFNDDGSDDGKNLDIEMWPEPRSLAPLRFGHDYQFRLRLVDICGHSAAYNFVGPPKAWSEKITYQRVDPINPPFVVAGTKILEQAAKNEQPEWVSEHWGEDAVTMIIRSRINSDDKLLFDREKTVRYLAPPKANLNFVLQHGTIDDIVSNVNTESFRRDLLQRADANLNASPAYYFQTQRDIDYLFDPLVAGFELAVDSSRQRLKYPSRNNGDAYWGQKKYFRLMLTDTRGNTDFGPDPVNDQAWVFSLPAGKELSIEMNCLVDDAAMASIRKMFFPGITLAKTAPMKMIHAVQKPCLLDEIYPGSPDPLQQKFRHEIQARNNCDIVFTRTSTKADCNFSLHFSFFPVLTSEAFLLHIKYPELVCDRSSSTGIRVNMIKKIIKTGFSPERAVERNVIFSDLLHAFDSTAHQPAYYKLEAVSKFKKYFDPQDFAGEKDAFSVFGTLPCKNNAELAEKLNPCITIEEVEKLVNGWPSVPSSARPALPVIDRIVPLMQWSVGKDGKTAERSCDAVRIYFSGDWYSSGIGEKIAVMFMDSKTKFNSSNVLRMDVNGDCTGTALDKVISQMGADPAAHTQHPTDLDKYFMEESFFVTPGENKVKATLGKMEFEKTEGIDSFETEQLTAAIYPIQFACACEPENTPETTDNVKEQRLGEFYVDVKFERKQLESFKLYTPFIRLAIARYQEHSIPEDKLIDYRFSKIVVSDFIQLLPYRKVVINTSKNEVTYTSPTSRREANASAFSNKVFAFAIPGDDVVDTRSLAPQLTVEYEYALENTLTPEYTVDEGADMKAGGFDIDIKGEGDVVVVNEYEIFQTPVVITDKDPRTNYSHRLIFSYVFDPRKKYFNDPENQEQEDGKKN